MSNRYFMGTSGSRLSPMDEREARKSTAGALSPRDAGSSHPLEIAVRVERHEELVHRLVDLEVVVLGHKALHGTPRALFDAGRDGVPPGVGVLDDDVGADRHTGAPEPQLGQHV